MSHPQLGSKVRLSVASIPVYIVYCLQRRNCGLEVWQRDDAFGTTMTSNFCLSLVQVAVVSAAASTWPKLCQEHAQPRLCCKWPNRLTARYSLEDRAELTHPLIKMSSSSQIRSCTTSSAEPNMDASNDSSPSKLASVIMNVAANQRTFCISSKLNNHFSTG